MWNVLYDIDNKINQIIVTEAYFEKKLTPEEDKNLLERKIDKSSSKMILNI